MLRIEAIMLAADRVDANLPPAASHYDSHLQADSRSRETGVHVRFDRSPGARKRFRRGRLTPVCSGRYVRRIALTADKVWGWV